MESKRYEMELRQIARSEPSRRLLDVFDMLDKARAERDNWDDYDSATGFADEAVKQITALAATTDGAGRGAESEVGDGGG